MTKRVPVQLAGANDGTLVALANDGSIWMREDGCWYRVPDLPQSRAPGGKP